MRLTSGTVASSSSNDRVNEQRSSVNPSQSLVSKGNGRFDASSAQLGKSLKECSEGVWDEKAGDEGMIGQSPLRRPTSELLNLLALKTSELRSYPPLLPEPVCLLAVCCR
jgi:hypothetical protein